MFFKTESTLQITPNIYSVCTKYVNFYIYKDENFTICIDTGFGISQIKKELQKVQILPEDVTHIFLTHSDKDHVGGISIFSKAIIYISKLEEPLINGEKKRSIFTKNSKIERNYEKLSDEEIITIGSIELKAISTPGHTIGSMSYLINKHFLFVGDTIELKKNKAKTGPGFMNMDNDLQKQSIQKLSKLEEITFLFTGHTGISKDFDLAVQDWVR